MKKYFSNVSAQFLVALVLVFMISVSPVKAGLDATSFLAGGAEDGGELMKAYMTPLGKSVGSGLNAGWYNTAKPHGLGRFDITVSFNTIIVPTTERTFNVNDLQLKSTRLKAGDSPDLPNFFGSKNSTSTMEVFATKPGGGDTVLSTFNAPGGIDFGMMFAPTAQLAVGLVFGTEVMVRYIPEFNFPMGLGAVKLFGFGIKHDVKQWIPVISLLPFDMSVMFGYTQFDLSLNTNPLVPVPGIAPPPPGDPQMLKLGITSYTGNLLLSKKIAILTLYGGIGFGQAGTKLNAEGSFPVPALGAGGKISNTSVPNPLDGTEIASEAEFRANAGFRLKFLFFTIHADYTYAVYPMITAGLGLNIDFK